MCLYGNGHVARKKMSEQPLKIIEHTIMLHQKKIDQSAERIHELDKKVDSIHLELRKQGHDIKQILSKMEIISYHDQRLTALEQESFKRRKNKRSIIKASKFLAGLWPAWVILILCFYAFDLKIEVQNPNVLNFILQALEKKL